jgi:hypothetical protein
LRGPASGGAATLDAAIAAGADGARENPSAGVASAANRHESLEKAGGLLARSP